MCLTLSSTLRPFNALYRLELVSIWDLAIVASVGVLVEGSLCETCLIV